MAQEIREDGVRRIGNLFSEVEPLSPYPRITSKHRQADNGNREEAESKGRPEERVLRRFNALRRLIDELQESHRVERVDYLTAEREMTSSGFATILDQLPEQLQQLGFTDEIFNYILAPLRQHSSLLQLSYGPRHSAADNPLFPAAAGGLLEVNLCLQELPLPAVEQNPWVLPEEGIQTEHDNLRLNFHRNGQAGEAQLRLDISSQVGVSEIDQAGRRAFLYLRPDGSYGLYADKQIDLSI